MRIGCPPGHPSLSPRYAGAMPTDKPSEEDVELVRLLQTRGIARTPRTVLGWRRKGAVWAADGRDEDDRPVFSEQALDHAERYATLVGSGRRGVGGHEHVVVHMWGEGYNFPRPSTVTGALRNLLSGLAVRYGGRSRSRAPRALLEHLPPGVIEALTDQANRFSARDADLPQVTRRDKSPERSESVPVTAADLANEAVDAAFEGLTSTDMEDIANLYGDPAAMVDIAEHFPGFPSIAERLRFLDDVDAGRFPFDQLVAYRDQVRTMLGLAAASPDFSRYLESFPAPFALLCGVMLDPAHGPANVVQMTLWYGTLAHRAEHTEATGQPDLQSAFPNLGSLP